MRSRDRKIFESHGNVFFITSTVVGFIDLFNHKQTCEIFIDSLQFCQTRGDFILLAWVLMPNHFHIIVKLSEDKNISTVIGNLKRFTARKIGELLSVPELKPTLERIKIEALKEPGKGVAIWKPRFDSFVITSENTLSQKIEYIHMNPVRKKLVNESWQWIYSSASAYARDESIVLPVDINWRCLGYERLPSGKDS